MESLFRHKEERGKSRWRLPLFFVLAIFISFVFVYETIFQLQLTFQGSSAMVTVIDIKKSGRSTTVTGEFSDSNGARHEAVVNFPGKNLGLQAKIPVVYHPSDPGQVYPQSARRFVLVVCNLVMAILMWGCFFSERMNSRKFE